ncbi:MAG: hypothetical protein M3R46_05225 [Actinomycetota bacterium]|jgi:hypothetical protein|nr:hypothetical protein [Actinomycetota bacterium]MDQ3240099.1 hypothetical protein [Actinomycetota bacterium]
MTVIMVSGALANRPFNGGGAWVRLSWARGLRRLGFEVVFVEQIAPEGCVDAAGAQTDLETSVNLAYFREVTERFGLAGSSVLIGGGERTYGLGFSELLEMAEEAELLVNLSGHLSAEPVLRRLRRTAYVDIDPGFTQFWHADGTLRLPVHSYYFTIGESIGSAACSIPTAGVRWRPIRQPVVLDDWPPAEEGNPTHFTTIASWRGPYGPIYHNGRRLGVKAHEFRKVMPLPRHTSQTFEIALDIHPGDAYDRERMLHHGWRLVDPREATADPQAFRRYVAQSGAEFSVAQGVYVDTNSGWVSDRTVRYLASGKPALVQDTGFARNYGLDGGLLPFRSLREAIAGARAIEREYEHHRRAARALAEEMFDSDRVLGRMLEEVGVAP